MSGFREWAAEEARKVVPPLVFFLLSFNILAITKALFLIEHDLELVSLLNATVAALIVAKVIVLVDLVPFVNRYPDKPLIYNTTWKTALYILATIVVRILEELFHAYRRHGDLGAAWRNMVDDVKWPHFLAVLLWLSLLFLIYVASRELVRTVGRVEVRRMFFGPVATRGDDSLL